MIQAGDRVKREATYMEPRYGKVLEVYEDWYYPTTHSTRKVLQYFARIRWDDGSARDVSVDLLVAV